MKNFKFLLSIVFILSLAIGANKAQAQSPVKMTVVSADTIANTGTTSKIINVTAGWSSLTIQPIVKKLSGTGAGTIALYASLDGVNYVATGDTYSITDVANQSTLFNLGVPKYAYYKIVATGSGTVSEVLNVWYLVRKYMTTSL